MNGMAAVKIVEQNLGGRWPAPFGCFAKIVNLLVWSSAWYSLFGTPLWKYVLVSFKCAEWVAAEVRGGVALLDSTGEILYLRVQIPRRRHPAIIAGRYWFVDCVTSVPIRWCKIVDLHKGASPTVLLLFQELF
jgi:hypothetical protein